jgi:hypothetical protein
LGVRQDDPTDRPGRGRVATKPPLARQTIACALDAGVATGWVTADEVQGGDPGLRADPQRRRVGQLIPFMGCWPGLGLDIDHVPSRVIVDRSAPYHQLWSIPSALIPGPKHRGRRRLYFRTTSTDA